VRASGVGYGRAVYFRLADGHTAVYGHLSLFAPALEAYVAAKQDSAGVYEQDLWPKAGEIRFRQGDILAWSGETGAGPPHLHFEWRRGDMNFDPLLNGFALPDHVPPTLASASITPAGPHARVNGGIERVGVRLQAGKVATAPPVAGPFDLAVDTWDRADGVSGSLATYRLEVRLDGAPAFEAALDSFSWDHTVEVERVYDYGATLAGNTTRRTLALLPSYRAGVVRRGPPLWALTPGEHRFEFVATDEAGNRTMATLVVPVVTRADAEKSGSAPAARKSAAAPARYRVRGTTLYATFAHGESAQPPRGVEAVDSLRTARGEVVVFQAIGAGEGQARLDLAGGQPAVAVVGARAADTTVELASGAALLRLAFPDGTLFEPAALLARALPRPGDPSGLRAIGDAIEVMPADLVLRNACQVEWRGLGADAYDNAGAPAGRLGLFVRQEAGWSFVTAADSAGVWKGSTRRLGAFAVFADTVPPTIVPPARYRVVSASGKPAPPFSVRLTDRGSGLSGREQAVYYDERRVPAEYDPESARLTWRPRTPLVPGRHSARIEAVDRLGNRAVATVPIEVR